MELKKNFWYKVIDERPPDDVLLLICGGNGYMELAYIEDGETHMPWRYDDNDIPVLSTSKIVDWMWIDVPVHTNQEIADSLP